MRTARDSERPTALIVTPGYLPLLGGMERECALLAQELTRRGFEPIVMTETQGMAVPARERLDGVEVLRIRSRPKRTLALQLRVAMRMAWLVVRHRHAAFAVVRTMTLPALAVGLLKRLRLIGFPTFVTAETGFDVVALRERPLYSISRWLASAHDCLNGLSQANVEDLLAGGFPPFKISAIPNGVDTSMWATAEAPRTVERLLFLGRLDREKGVFELVEAFANMRARNGSLRLTFAGEGPAGAELAARCAELQLSEGVDFVGRVPYEQLSRLFDEVDCLVLPSYSEGMPLSVLEAAAHRRAIVATEVSDLPRLFGDQIHLCRPRDVASLTTALERATGSGTEPPSYADVIASVSITSVTDAILSRLGVKSSD